MKAHLNTLPADVRALRNRKVAAWLALVVCATVGFVWLESNSSSHANASQTGLYSVPGQEAWRLAPNTTYTTTFAPLNIKPYGIPGVMNELNISLWGPDSFRTLGDAYSPQYIAGATPNPEYTQQPYGYLYRVEVPADFPDNHLLVQIFDPDTYNRPDAPPTPYTPVAQTPVVSGTPTNTPFPSPTYYPNDGRFTWCSPNDFTGGCTTWLVSGSTNQRYNTGLKLGAYLLTTTPVPTIFAGTGRTAFWRVDEIRHNHNDPGGPNPGGSEWSDSWADTTTFTLWHFGPNITDPFADPSTLSDQPGGAPVTAYTVGADPTTDLAWYQPSGYNVTLNDPSCPGPSHDCFARQANGNFYFYIYAQTSAGSSENNFDIRVGPESANYAAGYTCNDLSNPNSNICFANTQNFMQAVSPNPPPNWDSGGSSPASVSAMHALELNLDTGGHYPMLFTQLSADLAGSTLDVRHFDQDCTGGCGPNHTMQYQMQLCVADGQGGYTPCSDLNSDGCFGNPSGGNGVGYVGPNNGWLCPDGYDGNCPAGWTEPTDQLQIPLPGTADYTQFFGPQGQCSTSWLRLQSDPSYQQDTTVWQIIVESTSTSTPTSTATATPTYTDTPPTLTTWTPVPYPTQTAQAHQTETSVAATVITELTLTSIAMPTQTAAAHQTQTSVAATQTAGPMATLTYAAGATQTSISVGTETAVAATVTAGATQTSISATQTAVAATQTAVANATQTANAPTATRTNTPTRTATVAMTPTSTSTNIPINTPTSTYSLASPTSPVQGTASATSTATPADSASPPPASSPTTPAQPTNTATPPPTETATSAAIASATATTCSIAFIDVPSSNTFYPYVHCLACTGIINGYSDGTFRPNNNVTRGQLAKIVSNSAGFSDHQSTQIFQDVPPGSAFFDFVGRLVSRGIMQGYPCGSPGEPCEAGNLPYFRPASNATRGQISKIVSNAAGFDDPQPAQLFQDVPTGNAFHDYIGRLSSRGYMSGYPCGGPGEPCVPPANLPYFRPNNDATRGQTSKIVANTFFPDCQGVH